MEAVAALRHAVPVHALLHKRHAGKVTIAPVIRSYESRRGTRAPHICMAGLCYDRQPIEAMSFVVTIPNKTPYTVSYDFYQEKLPSKPLAERFRRKISLL